jgi:hypothetical protein
MWRHSDIVVIDDHQCHGQRQHFTVGVLDTDDKFHTGVTATNVNLGNVNPPAPASATPMVHRVL